jgi:carbonic anhydrase
MVKDQKGFNLLTTRSGRSTDINTHLHHKDTEAVVEMITQYLIVGRTKFKTEDLPEDIKSQIIDYQKQFNQTLDQIFDLLSKEAYIIVAA